MLTRPVTVSAIRPQPPAVRYDVRRIGPRVVDLSDEALLAGFAAADPELAAAFVRKFQARVFGVALRVLGDPNAAEDVAQSVFERAWRHAHTYDPRKGSVPGWLVVIARNLAIDTARVRPVVPVDVTDLVSVLTRQGKEEPGPEERAIDGDSTAQLRAALRTLPPEQARAIALAGLGGYSASQVASIEGIPLGTAKTRIRTAMSRLRASLSEVRSERA